jgi:hypothetical protein
LSSRTAIGIPASVMALQWRARPSTIACREMSVGSELLSFMAIVFWVVVMTRSGSIERISCSAARPHSRHATQGSFLRTNVASENSQPDLKI